MELPRSKIKKFLILSEMELSSNSRKYFSNISGMNFSNPKNKKKTALNFFYFGNETF